MLTTSFASYMVMVMSDQSCESDGNYLVLSNRYRQYTIRHGCKIPVYCIVDDVMSDNCCVNLHYIFLFCVRVCQRMILPINLKRTCRKFGIEKKRPPWKRSFFIAWVSVESIVFLRSVVFQHQ